MINDNVAYIQQKIAETRVRLKQAGGGDYEVWEAIYKELNDWKLDLAMATGEPYAVEIDLPDRCDFGAPMPEIVRNRDKICLLYYLSNVSPDWDGTTVNVVSTDDPEPEPIGMIYFDGMLRFHLDPPGEMFFDRLPLPKKTLDCYRFLEIKNSPWIEELKTLTGPDKVDERLLKQVKHYLYGFHDESFECLAQSYKYQSHCMSFNDAVIRAQKHLGVKAQVHLPKCSGGKFKGYYTLIDRSESSLLQNYL